MTICGIIAVAEESGIIGNSKSSNGLPWGRISEDLRYFKSQTDGCVVVMGRKTFEAMNHKTLSGRLNIVLTRDAEEKEILENLALEQGYDNLIVIQDLGELSNIHPDLIQEFGNKIWIIGGAEIFRKAFELDIIDELYVTYIKGEFEGEIYLEEVKPNSPMLNDIYEKVFEIDGKDELLRFEAFKRK